MYSIRSTNVGHRGSARASLSKTGSRGEPAMDRNARPAARRSMLGMSVTSSDPVEDERLGTHAVGGVVRCGPSGTSGEEFTQRPRLPALWISVGQKPVVEQEHRAVLQ